MRDRRSGSPLAPPQERSCREDGSERISEIVRDDSEHLISRMDGLLRDVVEAGVVERERRASSELLGQVHVLAIVPAAGATGHEGEHRDDSIAEDERDQNGGLYAERFEQGKVLFVFRHGAKNIGSHFAKQEGLPLLEHLPDGMVALGQNLLERFGNPSLARVGVDHPHPFELTDVLQDIDGAAFAHEVDRQLHDAFDGRAIVQGGLQRCAHLGEKLLPFEQSLFVRYVVAHEQVAHGIAAGVVPARDHRPRDELRAVLAETPKEAGRPAFFEGTSMERVNGA